MKNAVDVICKRLEMANGHDIEFRPSLPTSPLEEEKNDLFVMSPFWTSYCKEVYQSVKSEAKRRADYAVA